MGRANSVRSRSYNCITIPNQSIWTNRTNFPVRGYRDTGRPRTPVGEAVRHYVLGKRTARRPERAVSDRRLADRSTPQAGVETLASAPPTGDHDLGSATNLRPVKAGETPGWHAWAHWLVPAREGTEPMGNCPICQKPADSTFLGDRYSRWWCSQCGKFIISGTAVQLLDTQRATLDLGKLSQVVRRHPRDTEDWMCITSYNLDELIAAAG